LKTKVKNILITIQGPVNKQTDGAVNEFIGKKGKYIKDLTLRIGACKSCTGQIRRHRLLKAHQHIVAAALTHFSLQGS